MRWGGLVSGLIEVQADGPGHDPAAVESPTTGADKDGLDQAARFQTLKVAGKSDEFMVTFIPENKYHQRMRAAFERAIAVQQADGSFGLPEGIVCQENYYEVEAGQSAAILPHTILYFGV